MSAGPSGLLAPVSSVTEAIACMEAIDAAGPPSDGVACFNRMYLQVTQTVDSELQAGFFADPQFMATLDVTFANFYFAAVKASGAPSAVPAAWRPLVEQRSQPGIEPIQFALAGMNAHINHDLPLAVVSTCIALGTSPAAGAHLADYQKVDRLLDAAEQSVRQSFESAAELAVDWHLRAVCNLVACWSISSARDLAWNNCLLLWQLLDDPVGYGLLCDGLAAAAALASRLLLVAV